MAIFCFFLLKKEEEEITGEVTNSLQKISRTVMIEYFELTMTKEFLHNFIKKHKLAVLSTVTKDQLPNSAVVGFIVTPDLELFFDTLSDSRKYRNLISNPAISFVIGWDMETVQYEGTARIANEEELEKLLPEYFKSFPDGVDRNKNEKNIAYFCVKPGWIRYSDFNNKEEPRIEDLKM